MSRNATEMVFNYTLQNTRCILRARRDDKDWETVVLTEYEVKLIQIEQLELHYGRLIEDSVNYHVDQTFRL